jgi:hypothetical protein
MTKARLLEADTMSVSVEHADPVRDLDAPSVTMMSPTRTRRTIAESTCSTVATTARAGRSPLTSGPARELVASRRFTFRTSNDAVGP